MRRHHRRSAHSLQKLYHAGAPSPNPSPAVRERGARAAARGKASRAALCKRSCSLSLWERVGVRARAARRLDEQRENRASEMAERDEGQSRDGNGAVLLRGARVIDPARAMDGPGAVVIADGRIMACGLASGGGRSALLGPGVTAALDKLEADGRPTRVVELPAGWVIAPGFVDLHAHLREPGYEAKRRSGRARGRRRAAASRPSAPCPTPIR